LIGKRSKISRKSTWKSFYDRTHWKSVCP